MHKLGHRGPDGKGTYTAEGIGLAHVRLSLVDLDARSNQPFWDQSKRYCLVYNGEIYNHHELRKELKNNGIVFKTTSDTEVLLYGLLFYGIEKTLQKLEGMFAFALYDSMTRELVLARDRFGTKPIFIYDEKDMLVFSSEICAMETFVELAADTNSIVSYLSGFAGPSKGHSMFKNIKYLPPGYIARVQNGKRTRYEKFISISEYWNPNDALELQKVKSEILVDKVEELLFESVKKQLLADAPVGALCSGGVDSSIIMAMAAKLHNDLSIFHANVVGPNSEFKAAMKLANHLKLELKSVAVHDQDFIELMPDVISHIGQPYTNVPHSVPFMMVSQLVRDNGVKAVLSGEGADECYLGYNFLLPNLDKWIQHPISELARYITLANRKREKRKGRNVLFPEHTMGFSPYSSIVQKSLDHKGILPELILGLLNRFEVALETENYRNCFNSIHGIKDLKNYIMTLDLLGYNLRTLLHRNDTMGMAASIESRFPFLDSELVKLAINLPPKCKIRLTTSMKNRKHFFYNNKWIIRKIADRYLPRELSQRPKKGFPVNAYRRMKISSKYFLDSYVANLFELSKNEIEYLLNNSPHNLKLKLMQLEVWAQVFLENTQKHMIINKLQNHVSIDTNKSTDSSVINYESFANKSI